MELLVDLHTHTIASGHAYSTLKENFQEAQAKGLKMVAITDHGPQMQGAPDIYYFGNMRVLPQEYLGVELLRGVEANIMDKEGSLDVPEWILEKMDIVLAGYHPGCYDGGNAEENTETLIQVMKNPYVDIIVHPGNPLYPLNPEKLVQGATDLGVALEINNSSLTTSRRGSLENCQLIAKLAAQQGTIIALGSDAHFAPLIGDFSKARVLIKEAGLKAEQILNTDPQMVRDYLLKKRA